MSTKFPRNLPTHVVSRDLMLDFLNPIDQTLIFSYNDTNKHEDVTTVSNDTFDQCKPQITR
jgi:hypothetical protein